MEGCLRDYVEAKRRKRDASGDQSALLPSHRELH